MRVNSSPLYQLSYRGMDDEGLAPTKSKTSDLQSLPVAAWVIIPIPSRGLEPRLIALKGRGFSQLIYESIIRRLGFEPSLIRL
jgi:hypothetical protein